MIKTGKHGFTLVEILITLSIITMIVTFFLVFARDSSLQLSYGDNTAKALYEASFFFEHLKSDIANATFSFTNQNWDKMFSVSNNSLMFTINTADISSKQIVVYYYEKRNNAGSISRKVGNKSPQLIIKNRVASLSWQLITEEENNEPYQAYKRIFIKIHLALVKNNSKSKSTEPRFINFNTYLTPSNLIRFINK